MADRITTPCKDCQMRTAECHTSCDEYTAYKRELEGHKQEEYRQRQKERLDKDFWYKNSSGHWRKA